MKKAIGAVLSLVLLLSLLAGCGGNSGEKIGKSGDPTVSEGPAAELGDDDVSFGEDTDGLEGYFEEDTVDITVNCVSGTNGCYTLDGNVLKFIKVREDSVYSISGKLKGSIIIDVGDDYKFDLELQGLSLVSDNSNPIMIVSGDEVSVTAKSGYVNYIYDMRQAVDETDETAYSGAIHSEVDLEICGKGSLTLVSENNNGIHSKDDLQVKNLTLFVSCVDNALKGNDSVEITGGDLTLIATAGDGIKTGNTDISDKGNQRGTVTLAGGKCTIYAACDGIDAAYNVEISEDTTQLSIYTDKYSEYSSEVTTVDGDQYYIRFSNDSYRYSVKYYNSDEDYLWVNAQYHSTVSGGRSSYYYYAFPKMVQYSKLRFFIYSSDMEQGQDESYLVASDYLTPNAGFDTFALVSYGGSLGYQWTNYTATVQDSFGGPGGHGGPGGMGGMGDGNSDKGEYSTKGIKAGNEIVVNAGTVNVKSYDDAIHANGNTTLENGAISTGNVTVNGGVITVYSNDDGLHADGTMKITSGTVWIIHSYEGVEGNKVVISGGYVSVLASDDGINATATADTAIEIAGGTVYINCTGDGLDANSRTSYRGVVFSGGNVVVISNSSGNSAIDTEQGYSYTGGSVIAVMPSRGMTNETTHCQNFSDIAKKETLNLEAGKYLTVSAGDQTVATVKITDSLSALVVYLGSTSVDISTAGTAAAALDGSGICWISAQ